MKKNTETRMQSADYSSFIDRITMHQEESGIGNPLTEMVKISSKFVPEEDVRLLEQVIKNRVDWLYHSFPFNGKGDHGDIRSLNSFLASNVFIDDTNGHYHGKQNLLPSIVDGLDVPSVYNIISRQDVLRHFVTEWWMGNNKVIDISKEGRELLIEMYYSSGINTSRDDTVLDTAFDITMPRSLHAFLKRHVNNFSIGIPGNTKYIDHAIFDHLEKEGKDASRHGDRALRAYFNHVIKAKYNDVVKMAKVTTNVDVLIPFMQEFFNLRDQGTEVLDNRSRLSTGMLSDADMVLVKDNGELVHASPVLLETISRLVTGNVIVPGCHLLRDVIARVEKTRKIDDQSISRLKLMEKRECKASTSTMSMVCSPVKTVTGKKLQNCFASEGKEFGMFKDVVTGNDVDVHVDTSGVALYTPKERNGKWELKCKMEGLVTSCKAIVVKIKRETIDGNET